MSAIPWNFVMAAIGVAGNALCLLAMTTYDWKSKKKADLATRSRLALQRFSPRGRRWLAWGLPLALPWWVWSISRFWG